MNMTEFEASDLIYKHKRLYEVYWNWVGAYVEEALITGVAYTASGWPMHVLPKRNSKHPNWAPEINLRAIGNFPVQGTVSDILRATCINLYRAGIRVAAPVHDAVFVRCKLAEVEQVAASAKQIMIDSAEEVLQCAYRSGWIAKRWLTRSFIRPIWKVKTVRNQHPDPSFGG
jgi:DNA polymerase I-like protein with 3'-5' exonuclease and polymerase domains